MACSQGSPSRRFSAFALSQRFDAKSMAVSIILFSWGKKRARSAFPLSAWSTPWPKGKLHRAAARSLQSMIRFRGAQHG